MAALRSHVHDLSGRQGVALKLQKDPTMPAFTLLYLRDVRSSDLPKLEGGLGKAPGI